MDSQAKILARQRDRTIAAILDFKERSCDQYLIPEVSKQLRKVVLDNINDLTNLCLDLLDGAVINEKFVEMLENINEYIRNDI